MRPMMLTSSAVNFSSSKSLMKLLAIQLVYQHMKAQSLDYGKLHAFGALRVVYCTCGF